MLIPKTRKGGHIATFVSRKSVNRFIELGLRAIEAKPALYFHQTLTFPVAIVEAKPAKQIFNKFIKGVLKFYKKSELAIIYVQETRKDRTIHFHVCFLFFCLKSPHFYPSRTYRDFRTDIFRRWNTLNGGKAVHPANALIEHSFDLKSLNYFARALDVADEPAKRPETNWWGACNKHLIVNRAAIPTKQKKKEAFDGFFKKSSRKRHMMKLDQTQRQGTPSGLSIVQPVTVAAPKENGVFPASSLSNPFSYIEWDSNA